MGALHMHRHKICVGELLQTNSALLEPVFALTLVQVYVSQMLNEIFLAVETR